MEQLRYVILRHEGVAVPHFDVMIEAEPMGELHTWRSLDWPITQDTQLTRLEDHRPKYLHYEGPLANDRGHVKRVESGTCEVEWPNPYECELQLKDANATSLHFRKVDDRHWLATPAAHP